MSITAMALAAFRAIGQSKPMRKDSLKSRKIINYEKTFIIHGSLVEVFAFIDDMKNSRKYTKESSVAKVGSIWNIVSSSSKKTSLRTEYRRTGSVESLSAHADQNGLIDWMSRLKKKPEKIFIVHGESESEAALRVKIKDVFGWDCEIPTLNETNKI